MKFALLGSDPDALALARAAACSGKHQLVWACDVGPAAGVIGRFAPDLRPGDDWESLLVNGPAEAVIVGRDRQDEQRHDRLRKLVQAGLHLMVSHPVADSDLFYHELEMLRRDGCPVLLPYLPERWHPAIEYLFERLSATDEAALGTLEQVWMERTQQDRSEWAVITQFARDVDLARALAGELNRLHAMAPADGGNRWASVGLQLSGPGSVLVRWSVAPVEMEAGAKLTLLSSRGRAVVHMPQGSTTWSVTLSLGPATRSVTLEDPDPAGAALDRLAGAVAGEAVTPNWFDATRSLELADAIARSLARGRTIELHGDDYSEASTFRGLMASIGCGMLLLTLLVLPLGAMLARLGMPGARFVPALLLAVLIVFLLLQMLNLVLPRRPSRDP